MSCVCGIFIYDQPVALECDCIQWSVFVPVFHTEVMQAAGSCRIQIDCILNVMAHAQQPDLIFQRNGLVISGGVSSVDY